MSEELKQKIREYQINKTLELGEYGPELKRWYQQNYHASIDLSCNGCIGRALKRIIRENKYEV